MKTLRLALEWFLNPDHVPLLIALDDGFFEERGLSVELIAPDVHEDAAAALRAGDVDVAITEPIHLAQDVAAGHQVRGFARFLHTNGGVLYFRGGDITRPRDMAGKRVQYPGAPGPGGKAIVATMIRADGGEPGELVPVNNGFYHTNALIEGKADVATLAFFNFEVIEARHRGHDADFFALKDWGVPDFCQLILIATPEVIAEREACLHTLIAGMRFGIDVTKQDPERAWKVWRAHGGDAAQGDLARAVFDATLPCFTHDLDMAPGGYRELCAWLVQTDQSAAQPEPEQLWTSHLVR